MSTGYSDGIPGFTAQKNPGRNKIRNETGSRRF